jgi:hypothetical protein
MATKKETEVLVSQKGSETLKTKTTTTIDEYRSIIRELQAELDKQKKPVTVPEVSVYKKPRKERPTLANGGREWTMKDFEKGGVVDFVPQDLPGGPTLPYPLDFGDGIPKKGYRLTVNGVSLVLVIGMLNRAPKAFYHAYKNLENQIIELEEFKRGGPDNAPWVHGGINGMSTWFYQEGSPTAWFDIDGLYLNPNETYILYDGIPIPIGDTKIQVLKGNEISGGEYKAPTIQEHRERIKREAKEPEPAWHKTNPFKKRRAKNATTNRKP